MSTADATSPLISVVVPTYNRADFLPDAIDSVLAQTHANFELLVVDDGSTDDTESVVARYTDARIRYIVQQNQGVGAARNNGIIHARGEFIAFLDSDDMFQPDKLRLQLALFHAHPELGLVGGGCTFVDEHKRQFGGVERGPGVVTQADMEVFAALPGMASNEMVRREVFDAVGMFDTTLRRSQDRDMWLRVSRRYPMRTVVESTVLKRVHSTERPGINFTVIRECRARINRSIQDPAARRRADAWMYFQFFNLRRLQGNHVRALGYLLRSFITHPARINRRTPRLNPAAAALLPGVVQDGIRAVLGKGSTRSERDRPE